MGHALYLSEPHFDSMSGDILAKLSGALAETHLVGCSGELILPLSPHAWLLAAILIYAGRLSVPSTF